MSKEMPPLVELWFDSILFNHRLRHIATGFFVGDECFTKEAYHALYMTTNGYGTTLVELFKGLQIEGASYIAKMNMTDFEVVSELAPQ